MNFQHNVIEHRTGDHGSSNSRKDVVAGSVPRLVRGFSFRWCSEEAVTAFNRYEDERG